MRSHVPSYEMTAPASLNAALETMRKEPGIWRPFAGGTDLMVLFEAGKLAHKRFLSLWHLPELRGVAETDAHVVFGALTTYGQLRERRDFPLLARAAGETGAIAIQNRGTLGGNIANASPAADTPPALLAYGAEVELISAQGARWIPYDKFHLGYKRTVMTADELIGRVRVPKRPAGERWYYRKVGTRKAQAISKVCLAATATLEGKKVKDIRLAFGAVAPTVVRAEKAEAVVRGQSLDAALIAKARAAAFGEVAPIDDIRSEADYRRDVAANLVEEFLWQLAGTG